MPDQHQSVTDHENWVAVAQAEGIPVARHHLTVSQAAAVLRGEAVANGVSVAQLAADLVRAQFISATGAGPPRRRGSHPPQLDPE